MGETVDALGYKADVKPAQEGIGMRRQGGHPQVEGRRREGQRHRRGARQPRTSRARRPARPRGWPRRTRSGWRSARWPWASSPGLLIPSTRVEDERTSARWPRRSARRSRRPGRRPSSTARPSRGRGRPRAAKETVQEQGPAARRGAQGLRPGVGSRRGRPDAVPDPLTNEIDGGRRPRRPPLRRTTRARRALRVTAFARFVSRRGHRARAAG